MRALFSFFVIFVGTLIAAPETPQSGQTAEQVIEILGDPIGTIELRDKTLLLYPRGEITLREGLVTSVDLMDPAQFEAEQAILHEERADWLLRQERRAARQKSLGEAIRAEKLKDPGFAALPAKERLDFWREFQIKYPQVNVDDPIAAAVASYESELSELRSRQRIAALEKRVAQAENEAATARLETEKLREELAQLREKQRYGLRYYTDPRPSGGHYYYRPPTVTIFTNDSGTNRIETERYPNLIKKNTRSTGHPAELILNLID